MACAFPFLSDWKTEGLLESKILQTHMESSSVEIMKKNSEQLMKHTKS